MWSQILAGVLTVVVPAFLGLIGKVIADWSKRQKEKDEVVAEIVAKNEAISAIEIGIAKVQDDFVDAAKAAAKDGKLSKSEIQDAGTQLFNNAVMIATPAAAEYLRKISATAFDGITKWILGEKKAEAK